MMGSWKVEERREKNRYKLKWIKCVEVIYCLQHLSPKNKTNFFQRRISVLIRSQRVLIVLTHHLRACGLVLAQVQRIPDLS